MSGHMPPNQTPVIGRMQEDPYRSGPLTSLQGQAGNQGLHFPEFSSPPRTASASAAPAEPGPRFRAPAETRSADPTVESRRCLPAATRSAASPRSPTTTQTAVDGARAARCSAASTSTSPPPPARSTGRVSRCSRDRRRVAPRYSAPGPSCGPALSLPRRSLRHGHLLREAEGQAPHLRGGWRIRLGRFAGGGSRQRRRRSLNPLAVPGAGARGLNTSTTPKRSTRTRGYRWG